ncbi:MAG: hypothetical protein AAFR88_10415 [Pseudomonadota bacterium]
MSEIIWIFYFPAFFALLFHSISIDRDGLYRWISYSLSLTMLCFAAHEFLDFVGKRDSMSHVWMVAFGNCALLLTVALFLLRAKPAWVAWLKELKRNLRSQ